MVKFKNIDKTSKDYLEFARLYDSSFPKNEQEPIVDLIRHNKHVEMEACYVDDTFAGFYSAVKSPKILCLLYLAVEEKMRDKGVGTIFLNYIKNKHKDKIIILDVEMPENDASNELQRLSRKHFYYKNGFSDTEITYTWKNVIYQIMSFNGLISKKEYKNFYKRFGE